MNSFDSASASHTKVGKYTFYDDEDGLYVLERVEEGKDTAIKICSPISCIALTRDHRSEAWGRLTRITDADNIEHTQTIPAALLADENGELFAHLLQLGIRFSNDHFHRKMILLYLMHANTSNRVRCVSQPGWLGSVYVTGNEYGDVIGALPQSEEVHLQSSIMMRPCRIVGTLNEWRENISALAIGNSRMAFVISCAFASALLHPLGIHSGCFNLQGASSMGKTKLLLSAATVFGSYVESWRATDNGMEAVAAAHNDKLLVIDELGQMDPKKLGSVAYMIGNESGKIRMSGSIQVRLPLTWRLLALSSSETSMTDMMEEVGSNVRAGQETRVVDIPVEIDNGGFGVWENLHGKANGAAFSDHIENISRQYMGSAADAFLRKAVCELDTLRNEWMEYKKNFIAKFIDAKASGQVLRVAERFALVSYAGSVATRFGITGWPESESENASISCMKAWLSERGSNDSREWDKARDQIREFIELHGSTRFGLVPDDSDGALLPGKIDASIPNRVGFRYPGDDGMHFLILPMAWRKILCSGLSARKVTKELCKRGCLEIDSEGKPQVHRSIAGLKNQRYYHLLPCFWNN